MDDYISRQAARDWFRNDWDGLVSTVFFGIENIPPADVRENVKGKWIKKKGSLWTLATCSVCGELSVEGDKPFCPNCGAEMER